MLRKFWAVAPAYFSTFKNIEFKSKFLSKVKKPGYLQFNSQIIL
jgi:hypothetical protein